MIRGTQYGEMLERTIGNLGTLDIEPLQVLPGLQRGDTLIGNQFRVSKIQIRDSRRVFQLPQPVIADTSLGEVQPAQGGNLSETGKVEVARPTRAKIDGDHLAPRIARNSAAGILDPAQ